MCGNGPCPACAGPILDAVLIGGQSNGTGQGDGPPPAGIPDASIAWWPRVLFGPQNAGTSVLLPLDMTTSVTDVVYHGIELQLGLSLKAAHPKRQIAIGKVTRNGSAIASWNPTGGANWANLNTYAGQYQAALAAAFPSHVQRWSFVWLQGEFEAFEATEAPALAWAANFDAIRLGLGQTLKQVPRTHIVLTNANLLNGTWITTVRAQQLSTGQFHVEPSDLGTIDGVHYATPALNTIGARVAASILSEPQ